MASKQSIPSDLSPLILASNSRRQPMRQARVARKPAPGSKPGGRGGTTNGVNGQSASSLAPPAKFYPALSQFTDAIDALPAEAIRHFTLLCEVDAKACGPEANLRFLIESAKSLPAPDDPYEYDPALEALKTLDELQQQRDDFQVGREASMLLHQLETAQASEGLGSRTILGHPETRRARFAQIRAQITDLLKTQDEKIHVISTAYEALQKHLQRIEHTYGCVQMEIPDLYRLGSAEHWAYKDPIKRGTAAAQARAAERAQREAEERHNQQQREIETSNTRSETRREALARQKAAAAAAAATAAMNEEEEQLQGDQNHQHQQHLQPAKKLHGNSKIRKEQEALASARRLAEHQSAAGGGGLVPASGSPIPPQQPKRRKTNNTAREPSASVDKALAGEPSSRVIPSPRVGTPSAASRKGKSGTSTAGSRGGRSRNTGGPAASPSLASSPIHSTFPISAGLGRDVTLSVTGKSPDKQQDSLSRNTEWGKLASGSRVKKDKEKEKDGGKDEDKSTTSGAPGREGRPTVPAPDARDTTLLVRKFSEDSRHPISEDADMVGAGEKPSKPPIFQPADGGSKGTIPVSGASSPEKSTRRRKESIPSTETTDYLPTLELEKPSRRDGDKKQVTEANEKEKKRKRSIQDGHDKSPVSAPPTMTGEKHSRSYPPITASVKARPSTSDGVPTQPAQTPPGARRQQRKRADSSAAAMSNNYLKVEELEEDDPPAAEDDADADAEEDADEDEPVYCYCQQISYGEMVACDGENCPKEWFHLACAGLSQAPRGKAKWYCNDCKDSMTRGRRLGSKT